MSDARARSPGTQPAIEPIAGRRGDDPGYAEFGNRRTKTGIGDEGRRPAKPSARPPTIRDVAARAGVSPATVSNALSGLRGVTGDRRRAVLEAVEALGYKSNHMASSLRRGETRTVGIVVPNLGNEFYAGLVRQWEKDRLDQRL